MEHTVLELVVVVEVGGKTQTRLRLVEVLVERAVPLAVVVVVDQEMVVLRLLVPMVALAS